MTIKSLLTAIAVVGIFTAGFVPSSQAASAFNAPNLSSVTLTAPRINHGPGGLEVASNHVHLICFWHDTSGGTAFGKSGSCPYVAFARVGRPCSCNTPSGAQRGTIMVAPEGDGTLPVVR